MNDFFTKEERKLIDDCIKGKKNAHERFFNKYYGLMLGICLRYCSNKSDARDVVQEGFIKIFNSLPSYKRQGPFFIWMKSIFINTAIDKYRNEVQSRNVQDISDYMHLKSDEEDVLSRLNANEIINCLERLPEGCRVIFNLFAIDGLTHKEIAEQLGITEGTSKSQVARAREYLKKMIGNQSF